MKTRVSLLLGACGALLFSGAALAQSAYSALQLSGGFYYTINNNGQAAGYDSTGSSIVYTDANGLGLHTFDTPAGLTIDYGAFPAINNLGQVVGTYITTDESAVQGFYTTTSGSVVSTTTNGQPLPGITSINDHGQMVGFSFNASAPLISQDGASWQPISALDNGVNSFGQASRVVTNINNQGQVSGITFGATDVKTFFANADGSHFTEPVNSLNGATQTDPLILQILNDKGQIIGNYQDTNGNAGVYLTGPNGTGVATINGISHAYGLNNAGQIAGYRYDASGSSIAVITGANGQNVADLNTLYSIPGDSFEGAMAINDVGQILVYTANGNEYLLTPLPEASTSMLMLLGLSGLVFARRRKH